MDGLDEKLLEGEKEECLKLHANGYYKRNQGLVETATHFYQTESPQSYSKIKL